MILGFFLTCFSTRLTNPGGFQDFLFGFGILLWIIGGLGSVYAVVNWLAGPRAARLAIVLLMLALLSEVVFGGEREKRDDYDDTFRNM